MSGLEQLYCTFIICIIAALRSACHPSPPRFIFKLFLNDRYYYYYYLSSSKKFGTYNHKILRCKIGLNFGK